MRKGLFLQIINFTKEKRRYREGQSHRAIKQLNWESTPDSLGPEENRKSGNSRSVCFRMHYVLMAAFQTREHGRRKAALFTVGVGYLNFGLPFVGRLDLLSKMKFMKSLP